MRLGQRIQACRRRKGFSQHELARRAGIRQALVSQLESGKKHDALASTIRAIAIALDTSMDYLCDRFDDTQDEDDSARAVAD
jgi:transcriptional regulator with XRE-family HTH domain